MIPDSNWKETRATSEDISHLLGIPVDTTEKLFKILENLVVHKLLESLEDCPDCTNFSVELPYIGTLVVDFDDNSRIRTNFSARKSFISKIKKAYSDKESPLVKQCSGLLGEYLVREFEGGDVSSE